MLSHEFLRCVQVASWDLLDDSFNTCGMCQVPTTFYIPDGMITMYTIAVKAADLTKVLPSLLSSSIIV